MVEGQIETFDFVLAEALGKHVHEIRALPNAEVTEWEAFYTYRRALQEQEDRKAGRHG